MCAGSTHDSLAFSSTDLGQRLEAGERPELFFIVGDEAYRSSNYMLTPWSGRNLPVDKDAFKFYQNRMRINIECAFGFLVQRWGTVEAPSNQDTQGPPADHGVAGAQQHCHSGWSPGRSLVSAHRAFPNESCRNANVVISPPSEYSRPKKRFGIVNNTTTHHARP